MIAFSEEYYRFNRTLDFDYDVESYQKELEQARTLEDPQKKIAHYRAALKYYRGAFLPELSEQWAVTERERLHQSFLDTLLKLAALHLESGQHEAAIADCHRALVEDPCLEAAHRLAMRTHAAMGNRAAIARQFEQCQLALLQEIGASPSQQTVSLYETLVKSD